jgi:drug/metabolite transporter (DMT)-like permease
VPILLGALASLFIGISDTFGRSGAKRANSFSVVTMSMAVGIPITAIVSIAVGGDLIGRDLLFGAISGLLIATGLGVNYRGMAETSAAIVSPISAVLAALFPLLWDVVGGARPSALAWTGCVVALVALGFTTFNPNLGGRVAAGVAFGLFSGVLFGAGVTFLGETMEDSGSWPIVAQRTFGMLAVAALTRSQGAPLVMPSAVRHHGLFAGLAGGIGMVCLIIGTQTGDLGEVAVAGSMFPAVVAVLSAIFDDDELRWWQGIGIAGAILGTALIALG